MIQTPLLRCCRRHRRRRYLEHERNIYKLFPFISISIPFIMWQVSAFFFSFSLSQLRKCEELWLQLLFLLLPLPLHTPSSSHQHCIHPYSERNGFECEIKRRNGEFSHQILMIAAEVALIKKIWAVAHTHTLTPKKRIKLFSLAHMLRFWCCSKGEEGTKKQQHTIGGKIVLTQFNFNKA